MLQFFTKPEFWQGVLATLLGFFFAVAWDVVKDWRREVKEAKRAVRLVSDEIEVNITLLQSIREHLVKDSEAAKEGKLVLDALPTLPIQAWQATRLAGSFSPASAEFVRDIGHTYHQIGVLNQRIQARELFKITSQPLDRFSQQRAMINAVFTRICSGPYIHAV